MQDAELASWKAAHAASGSSDPQPLPAYNRLATEHEVAALVGQAEQQLAPKKDPAEGGHQHPCGLAHRSETLGRVQKVLVQQFLGACSWRCSA
jgi:hypothetical protein